MAACGLERERPEVELVRVLERSQRDREVLDREARCESNSVMSASV